VSAKQQQQQHYMLDELLGINDWHRQASDGTIDKTSVEYVLCILTLYRMVMPIGTPFLKEKN